MNPSIWIRVGVYGSALALSLLLTVFVYRLWRADLHVLLAYNGDGLQHTVWIKNLIETGWFDHNPRFGAPGGQDLREFPQGDLAHYLVIRVMTWCTHDACLIFNLYYLLSFPLVTLTSTFVLRRLGMSSGVAVVLALLYTFAPYHLYRQAHLFLAHYALIPLSILGSLRLAEGRPLFSRSDDPRTSWTRCDIALALGFAVLLGTSGVYYALFSCFFLFMAGILGTCSERRWVPLGISTALIAIIFGSLVVAFWPSIEHKLTGPYNPEAIRRHPGQTEYLGLKITQLLMPVRGHPFRPFAKLHEEYNSGSTPLITENLTTSLGLVASVGFLFLLIRLLRRRETATNPTLHHLSLLLVCALLLATVGGFGTLMAYVISPWLRAYNRIAIVIMFLGLIAVAYLLEHWRGRCIASGGSTRRFHAALVLLLVLGILDQTNRTMVPNYRQARTEAAMDQVFIAELERQLPPGSLVYQLPYRVYPEAPGEAPGLPFAWYDLLRPHVHSRTLHWSFGSSRGHTGDLWARRLEAMTIEEKTRELARAGWACIYIDRWAYEDRATSIEHALRQWLGDPIVVSEQQRFVCYDLRRFRTQLQERYTPAAWERLQAYAAQPILAYWRKGFLPETTFPVLGAGRVGQPRALMELHNPLSQTRRIDVSMNLDLLACSVPVTLRMYGMEWSEELLLEPGKPRSFTRTITAKPGWHPVRFELEIPPGVRKVGAFPPGFRVTRFTARDVEETEGHGPLAETVPSSGAR